MQAQKRPEPVCWVIVIPTPEAFPLRPPLWEGPGPGPAGLELAGEGVTSPSLSPTVGLLRHSSWAVSVTWCPGQGCALATPACQGHSGQCCRLGTSSPACPGCRAFGPGCRAFGPGLSALGALVSPPARPVTCSPGPGWFCWLRGQGAGPGVGGAQAGCCTFLCTGSPKRHHFQRQRAASESMEQEEGDAPHVDFIQYIASAGDTVAFPSPRPFLASPASPPPTLGRYFSVDRSARGGPPPHPIPHRWPRERSPRPSDRRSCPSGSTILPGGCLAGATSPARTGGGKQGETG